MAISTFLAIEIVVWTASTAIAFAVQKISDRATTESDAKEGLVSAVETSETNLESSSVLSRPGIRRRTNFQSINPGGPFETGVRTVSTPTAARSIKKWLLLSLIGYALSSTFMMLLYRLQESHFLYCEAIPCGNITDGNLDEFHRRNCDYSVKGVNVEDIFLSATTEDGTESGVVHAVWMNARRDGEFFRESRTTTVVFSHGNIENLSFYKRIYEFLIDCGLNVVAWDYPGFGKSSGLASEPLINAAFASLLERLQADKKLRPDENVVLWGYSLGGFVAANLAARVPFAGVILHSPIDSAASVLRNTFPLMGWAAPLLRTQSFDTESRMPLLRNCLLLFVGREDEQFSRERERALFVAANNVDAECSDFFDVEGLGHLGNPLDNHDFRLRLKEFFKKIVSKRLE